jgi:hypothetical protein
MAASANGAKLLLNLNVISGQPNPAAAKTPMF